MQCKDLAHLVSDVTPAPYQNACSNPSATPPRVRIGCECVYVASSRSFKPFGTVYRNPAPALHVSSDWMAVPLKKLSWPPDARTDTAVRAPTARSACSDIARSVSWVGLCEMKPRTFHVIRVDSIVACGMSMSTGPTG